MNESQSHIVIRITRYGLPLVVGIFYLTASLGFEFTSDSTLRMASFVQYGFLSPPIEGSPSPLWWFLVSIGGWFHVDLVLASKVLSLVFCCGTILVGYLVANEILRDRLIAFCVSLMLALQGWLLQLAPSGSALSLAIVLILTALFYMLRNEYVVAPFILGLCTLVLWQAMFLLIPLCIDIRINSVSKQRSWKVILSACVVYLSALLPWAVYAVVNSAKGAPMLLGVSELPPLSITGIVTLSILGMLGMFGLATSLQLQSSRMELLRTNGGALVFVGVLVALGSIVHVDVWYAVLPLVVVYSFFGLAEVLKRMGEQRFLHSLSLVFTAFILLLVQFDYHNVNKPSIARAVEEASQLRSVAAWISTNVPSGQSVAAECVGTIEYYAERPVALLQQAEEPLEDFVVSSGRTLAGYEIAFSLPASAEGTTAASRNHVIWRKK